MSLIRPLAVVLFILLMAPVFGADTPVIDPAKAAQLQRLEPLTPEKIDVFVEAGKLTPVQAEYVKKHIGPNGQLALPDASVAPEPVAPVVAAPAAPGGGVLLDDPYAGFNYSLSPEDRERLTQLIQHYRYGNRDDIARQIHKFMPQINQLITAAYPDPIDLMIKKQLFKSVSGRSNPEAVFGLIQLHKEALRLAQPVLIAFDKDAGGVMVRRTLRGPGDPFPEERFMTSRDLRNAIEDIEGYISVCSSVTAATYLMEVYAQRYDRGEAPMRDTRRDRHRLVDACGGAGMKELPGRKRFDEDEAKTWSSSLTVRERALIADRLIPYLQRPNDDCRQIARDGLMICLPGGHPSWKAGTTAWEAWWAEHKDALMNK